MQESRLLCPHCKNDTFLRKTKSEALVHIFDHGDVILDDVIRTLYEENTYICENCKKDVTDDELVRAI